MSISNKLDYLLKTNDITAYRLSIVTGISEGLISNWKNGIKQPSSENLLKLSKHFGVSVDYILGNDEQKESPVYDDEALGYLDELRNRPEMRMLFKTAKNSTKEDIERTVKIIEALKGSE